MPVVKGGIHLPHTKYEGGYDTFKNEWTVGPKPLEWVILFEYEKGEGSKEMKKRAVSEEEILKSERELLRGDRHYHDCDEYWLVAKGRARVWSGGKEYTIEKGDILITEMGHEHEVIEALEDFSAYAIGVNLRGQRRRGHLYKQRGDA